MILTLKILWIINTPFNSLSEILKGNKQVFGGWLEGAYNTLSQVNGIELGICFPYDQENEIERNQFKSSIVYSFKNNKNTNYNIYKKHMTKPIMYILNNFNPEVIHVWGTEFTHSRLFIETFNKPQRTIVSLQGLISFYSYHYYAGLQPNQINTKTIRDILKRDSIKYQKIKFTERGVNELFSVKLTSNVIGRTNWDYICSNLINKDVSYHFCNEILRDKFYESPKYNLQETKNINIFISQGNYPIKGFHVLLKAVSLIKNEYPEIRIRTTTRNVFEKPFYRLTAYDKILRKMISEYKLKDNIEFLGVLDEEQMIREYLSCTIFISPSAIENSPNSVGEAKILGVPTIASNVGGISEMISHNYDGLLYPFDEFYMLAWYIKELSYNYELRKKISFNAIKSAEKMHSKDINTLRLIEIYNEVNKK